MTCRRVLVASPPLEASGGIGRVLGYELDHLNDDPDLAITHLDSRGAGAPLASLAVMAEARRHVRRHGRDYDLLHLNLSTGMSSVRKGAIAASARRVGLPYLIHLHGSGYDEFYRNLSPILRPPVKRMFSGAARVVVLGEYWREFVLGLDPSLADRTVVLPNATPPPTGILGSERASRPQRIRLCFLGNLGPRKGPSHVIDALGLLIADGVDAELEIAGDGDEAPLRARAVKLGVADRVRFHGWIGRDAVSGILGRSHYLVLPSAAENQPLVIIEAMAHGVVPLASTVGAIPDLIDHGVTGFLLEDLAGSAIANSIAAVEEGSGWDQLSKASRVRWEAHFSSQTHAERLKAIWLSVKGAR